ncbi:MAG: phosphodiester glycosidase family protein [Anaerolineae bacterium]|nr:phosphodiester glycosidase family protein [Anaerolineae bacterium]
MKQPSPHTSTLSRLVCVLCLLGLAGLGCNLARQSEAYQTASPEPPPGPTPAVDGWSPIGTGIEQRTIDISLGLPVNTQAVVIRLDPAYVTFSVHYNPNSPPTLAEWGEQLPQAAVIVNGAFFDEYGRAMGLLVSHGDASGQSYNGFGGMFQVDVNGPRVRSLVTEPYQGGNLLHAVQAFPMLIEAGGVPAPQGEGFDQRARRTVIGQDWNGRIVIAITPLGVMSLAELQEWLLNSDLNLAVAFALDGGRSTGMLIRTKNGETLHPAFDRLPSVIAAYTP